MNERNITSTTKKIDNVRDVVNNFHQKNFVVVDFKFIKSIIVIFQIVKKTKFFFKSSSFSKKNRRFRVDKNYIRLNYTVNVEISNS